MSCSVTITRDSSSWGNTQGPTPPSTSDGGPSFSSPTQSAGFRSCRRAATGSNTTRTTGRLRSLGTEPRSALAPSLSVVLVVLVVVDLEVLVVAGFLVLVVVVRRDFGRLVVLVRLVLEVEPVVAFDAEDEVA